MGEIGSGTGSSYPAALDTNNTLEVNSPNAGKTKARAEVPNDLGGAVVAIETELGTDPAGSVANVKTYLQTEHGADGTHDNTKVAMLAGTQTITGDKTLSGTTEISGTTTLSGTTSVTGAVSFTDNPTITNIGPYHELLETGVTANNKAWQLRAESEQLKLRTANDAKDTFGDIFTVDRTGTTVDGMEIFPPLTVNGGIQTDGTNTFKIKLISIGDWDMDATASVAIAHGLTYANILDVSAAIRNDTDTLRYNLGDTTAGAIASWITWGATNINLEREAAGPFDHVDFNSTSFNRGWITVTYLA